MSDRTTVSDDDQGNPSSTRTARRSASSPRSAPGPPTSTPTPGSPTRSPQAGWSDADEDDYPLPADEIAVITDDEIRLT
ncbi:PRC-barrel domain containing protein [Halosimplex aquaticum]